MSWVKVDDQFFRHPKVLAAGRDARDLYLVGLCYCAQSLTDGFIPAAAVRVLAAEAEIDTGPASTARLIAVGLWEPTEGGYAVHDYLEYQPTKERVIATREARAEAGRRGGKQKASNLLDKTPSKTLAKSKQNSTPYPSRTHPVERNVDVGAVTEGVQGEPRRDAPASQQQPEPRLVRPVPKAKDRPPPPEELPLWDALAAGIGVSPVTVAERGLYGGAVKQLRALGATGDDVLSRCANYRLTWPDMDLTVPALLKHWSRMQHPPPRDKLHGRRHRSDLTPGNVVAVKEAF